MVLVTMALPVLDMRLGQADAGTDPTSTTQRRAYDLLASGFGDGFNGPLLLTIDLGAGADPAVLDTIAAAVAGDPGVRAVSPPETNAAEATIRKVHALSIGENSVHGSDAPETAAEEIRYWFAGTEVVG